MNEFPAMKSLAELADETPLTYGTLRRLCISGKIKYIVCGRKWLINCDSLRDYLNQGETFEHVRS